MSIDRSCISWGICLLTLILIGCGSSAPASPSVPAYSPCIPAFDDANSYRADPQNNANIIFMFAQGIPVPGTANSQVLPISLQTGSTAKREALKLLANRVRRWSQYTDVPVNDRYLMRITITFVSPDIIEAIVLNQVLMDGSPVNDLSSEVLRETEVVRKRNELIFLLTLTLNEYVDTQSLINRVTVMMPVDQITLTTSLDVPVSRSHTDHYLGKPLNILTGPAYGYIAYPAAILRNGICEQVIDPVYTTTLAIDIPDFIINDTRYATQTLNIEYQPLLKIGVGEKAPDLFTPATEDVTQYFPTPDPPSPAWSVSRADYWDDYWRLMSRFVWYYLTDTTHP